MQAISIIKPKPKIPGFVFDSSLALYLPLHQLDGNAFSSKDRHGHVCAVTGALWTPQGRLFDGIDDKINCGVSSILNPLSALTLEVWFYITGGAGTDRGLIYRWDIFGGVNERTYGLSVGADDKLAFSTSRDGTDAAVVTVKSLTVVSLNAWHYGLSYWDGTNNVLYLDNVLQGSAAQASIKTSPNTQTGIGANLGRVGDASGAFMNGYIGEAMIYSVYSQLIQRNYLTTKWRYS